MITKSQCTQQRIDFLHRNEVVFGNVKFNEFVRENLANEFDSTTIPKLMTFGLSLEDCLLFIDSLRRPEFKIWKVPAYPGFLRVYLYQALYSDFGFSVDLNLNFLQLNKKIEELEINEVEDLLINADLLKEDKSQMFFYYFFDSNNRELFEDNFVALSNFVRSFENKEYDFLMFSDYEFVTENVEDLSEIRRFHYGEFPSLFTDLISVNFDNGGLVKMECFNNQIYYLLNSDGLFIEGPCHDIDLLDNNKYIYRSSLGHPGFHLCKIEYSKKSWDGRKFIYSELDKKQIDCFGDLDSTDELLEIFGRDKLVIENNSCFNIKLENFIRPLNVEEAKIILENTQTNYITSPDLSIFYQNDKETALLALRKNPLVFTLLQSSLKFDKDVIRSLCYDTQICLNGYFEEYKINPKGILEDEEVIQLVKSKKLSLTLLPIQYQNNRIMLLAAASSGDSEFGILLQMVDEIHRNDDEIILAGLNSNPSIFELSSEDLRNNRDFVIQAVKINFKVLEFLNFTFKMDTEIVSLAIENNAAFFVSTDNLKFEKLAEKYSPLLIKREYIELINEQFTNHYQRDFPF